MKPGRISDIWVLLYSTIFDRSKAAHMSHTIFLEVSHSRLAPGPIEGFRFLWAYYVKGYRPDRKCQSCFKGRIVQQFSSRTASSGRVGEFNRMDRFPYVYVCGVAVGPRRERRLKNLHFPLRYSEGQVAEATTYNGYTFRAHNAVVVPIPVLPPGWDGIDDLEQTNCRNFQFAVSVFGGLPTADCRLPTADYQLPTATGDVAEIEDVGATGDADRSPLHAHRPAAGSGDELSQGTTDGQATLAIRSAWRST